MQMNNDNGHGQFEIKVYNRNLVLNLIEKHGNISRIQLAKITHMSPTSMTRIMNELTSLKLIKEGDSNYQGMGRKSTMLEINPEAYYSLGISIDVNTIKLCILNFNKDVLILKIYNIDIINECPEKIAVLCFNLYEQLVSDNNINSENIKIIGVSFPGTLDPKNGVVTLSPRFRWHNVEFAKMCKNIFGLETILENDVKASIYNEYYRHEIHQVDSLAFLNVGSGIGASYMYKGEIIRGVDNAAGEIGHSTVVIDGDLCDCGKKGCLAAYLCENKILEQANSRNLNIHSFNELVEMYQLNNANAVCIFKDIAKNISIALNSIICTYNPEEIVVGGSTFVNAPFLLTLALSQKEFFYEAASKKVIIELTKDDGSENVIGAALIANTYYCRQLIENNS